MQSPGLAGQHQQPSNRFLCFCTISKEGIAITAITMKNPMLSVLGDCVILLIANFAQKYSMIRQ